MCVVCELNLVAVRIFWVVFVSVRAAVQPWCCVVQSMLKAAEKVPVDCVGFGSQPNTTLLQISCIFLKMIATGYMFRPATD